MASDSDALEIHKLRQCGFSWYLNCAFELFSIHRRTLVLFYSGPFNMLNQSSNLTPSYTIYDLILPAQVLLNCHGGGSCHGGDPYEAFVYMAKKGLPDQTCQNYEAEDQICKPLG